VARERLNKSPTESLKKLPTDSLKASSRRRRGPSFLSKITGFRFQANDDPTLFQSFRRLLFVIIFSVCGFAVADEALERRVTDLAHELRCLVCQNQTLADSNAPLAVDLRNQIREQLAGGASERDVREFMVARYGDFILYRPPFKATTVLLWLGPFLLLAFGMFILIRRLRRRAIEPRLSEAERSRAARLLE
jgi:cytochrome c-type biogenesis protein CcmH